MADTAGFARLRPQIVHLVTAAVCDGAHAAAVLPPLLEPNQLTERIMKHIFHLMILFARPLDGDAEHASALQKTCLYTKPALTYRGFKAAY